MLLINIFFSFSESTVSPTDMKKKGFLNATLYDYDFIGRDDLMGDVFLPFSEVKNLDNEQNFEKQPQVHLPLTKPDSTDEEKLKSFELRTWDKEALKFARGEREKIEWVNFVN